MFFHWHYNGTRLSIPASNEGRCQYFLKIKLPAFSFPMGENLFLSLCLGELKCFSWNYLYMKNLKNTQANKTNPNNNNNKTNKNQNWTNQTNKTANKPCFRRHAEQPNLNKSYPKVKTGPSHPKHCMPLIIHNDPWLLLVYLGRQRIIILTSFSKAL